jgi:hypothetical protein
MIAFTDGRQPRADGQALFEDGLNPRLQFQAQADQLGGPAVKGPSEKDKSPSRVKLERR